MTFNREKHQLWLINQHAVLLNLVTQEEADLCTLHDKSLQYRINDFNDKINNPVQHAEKAEQLKKGMWD